MKKTISLLAITLLLAAGCGKPPGSQSTGSAPEASTAPTPGQPSTSPAATETAVNVTAPINDAKARITKKFFGTYVTPQNSPVRPERFTGYHTGLDFETFPDEQSTDTPVNAICPGKLLRKGYAAGYGGYAVQACTINGQGVTVVYGHLRLPSIKPAESERMAAGEHLAVLGTGYSKETDGERKHLHLGIHRGDSINLKGYVQNKNELSGWMDPKDILGL